MSPKPLKKIQKVIFENRNHENNPEREARKKASFLGLSYEEARVEEVTSGVFSDFL
jgi:hypothetical protein